MWKFSDYIFLRDQMNLCPVLPINQFDPNALWCTISQKQNRRTRWNRSIAPAISRKLQKKNIVFDYYHHFFFHKYLHVERRDEAKYCWNTTVPFFNKTPYVKTTSSNWDILGFHMCFFFSIHYIHLHLTQNELLAMPRHSITQTNQSKIKLWFKVNVFVSEKYLHLGILLSDAKKLN